MAAEFITNVLVSTFLETTIDNLASRFGDIFRGKKANKKQLSILKLKLLAVDVVADDAEQKQFTDPRVRDWLLAAKGYVFDPEDLLDEIDNALTKSQVEAQSQNAAKKVLNSLKSTFVSFFKENEIESRMEQVIEDLEDLATRSHVLGLKRADDVGVRTGSRLSSTYLPNESDIYGREDDKQFVLNWLKSNTQNNLSILCIVGMGGVDEFDVFKVSRAILEHVTTSIDDSRDIEIVHRRLKEKLTGKKFLLILDDVWNKNQFKWEEVQKPLVFGAQGSRILVTTRSKNVASTMRSDEHSLEQLQQDHCWKLFAKHAFRDDNTQPNQECREIGMKIVKKCKGLPLALKTMGSMLHNKSSVSEWKTVFQSEIWEFSKEHCDIIPALALSYIHLPSHMKICFVYCALFPKDYMFKKEDLIQLWMTENFAHFCQHSRTPEEVCEQYFNDLLSRSFFQNKKVFDMQQYIKDLHYRSFSQNSHKTKEVFVMHDLLHDLAKYVGGGLYFRCELDQTKKIQKVARYFSFDLGDKQYFDGFGTLCNTESLRTFVPKTRSLNYSWRWGIKMSIHELFSKFKFLHILSLSHCSNLQELPDPIGNLEYLRSLDLSHTVIKRLNENICLLSHLQILKLNFCRHLEELPSNLHLLTNLCRLEIIETELRKVPPHLGKLKNLKVVVNSFTFNVGRGRELGIQQLGELNLDGSLSILELQNIENSLDALKADFKNKTQLVALMLVWGFIRNSIDSKKEEEVIENLQPSKNLKKLSIVNYGGKRFPNWLLKISLWNMVSLVLDKCISCQGLPPLGLLPFLKVLRVTRLDGIVSIDSDFHGNNSSSFKSLETLNFSFMSQWETWECQAVTSAFPRLQHLSIKNCPKLKGQLPKQLIPLETLQIEYCQQLEASAPRALELQIRHCGKLQLEWGTMKRLTMKTSLLEIVGSSNTLENLQIDSPLESINDNCVSLGSFPLDLFPTLRTLDLSGFGNLEMISQSLIHNHLEEVTLNDCLKFESFPGSMHMLLPSLRSLCIQGCSRLESFPEGGLPSNLEKLTIQDCRRIESLPNEGFPSSLQTLRIQGCSVLESFPNRDFPSNLEGLTIQDCPRLESFPNRGFPSNLQNLTIQGCSVLESFPEGGFPSNLEEMTIKDCPRIESFPDGGFPSNLKELAIQDCPRLASFPDRGFPSNLQTLTIQGCSVLESFPDGGFPSNLEELTIQDCPRLESFPDKGFPSNLQTLTIQRCSVLESFPDKGFPSNLEKLTIKDCPRIESFPDKDFPSNLQTLRIQGCSVLQSFPDRGFPSNLKLLQISNCSRLVGSLKGASKDNSLKTLWIGEVDAECFPHEDLLPLSLTSLTISDCPNLEKLDYKGLHQLSSLQNLYIKNCPNLQRLPEEGLPKSISYLDIRDCPLLQRRCWRERGEDWEKIAHIQTRYILK
ncbi:hypothetical protein PHAVU_011G202900 [Phaseolus vulgaris]|uniref:NB-ARC domain-containing protein n=1 Tax=Phaseolus vulgaris TaxID=3885 RepID=V7AKD4_PHAVU|nr:hypothetical protein PHAVU_011G202900g [Phaseolus vulgaris]ESW05710.1 hypothetical protein PHAVU_011G202900g [Phaseolus vulgaris]